jgi:hypothetical protein
MSKKQRFEELILKVNSSLSKINESKSDSFMSKVLLAIQTTEIKNLIESHSRLNEIDYYKERNEIPAMNSKIRYYEISKMYEIVFELFANELIKKN